MPLEALVSSDSHIVEPPDLWTSRMRGDFAERAPRVVSEDTGDWWYIDGKRSMSFLRAKARLPVLGLRTSGLLDGHGGSRGLQLLLYLVGLVVVDALFDRSWCRLHQLFGLPEAKSGHLSHRLNDVDLVCANVIK